MKAKNTISHRDRKNGAAREAWEKRKQAFSTARGPQQISMDIDTGDMVYGHGPRRKST